MDKKYNAISSWNSIYTKSQDIAFPPEGLIRILKGQFPDLNFDKSNINTVLDIGCGDGRNFPLYNQMGWQASGTEISEIACDAIKQNLSALNLQFDQIKFGLSDDLPFAKASFDLVVSWNSCYYMSLSREIDFSTHINEMSRVLKRDGFLIISVPMKTCFIFDKAEEYLGHAGYIEVKNDPWELRNGEIMRMFKDEDELISELSPCFQDFSIASIKIEWFGLSYHWHVLVCRKR